MTKIITKGVRYNSQMYKYGDSHNKMMITWNTKKGGGGKYGKERPNL